MLPTTIRSPPSVADYTPLSEYQSQTPETFHGEKHVLYYHATGARAWIPKSQRGNLSVFPADLTSEPSGPEAAVLNGSSEDQVEQTVDVFVTSEYDSLLFPSPLPRHVLANESPPPEPLPYSRRLPSRACQSLIRQSPSTRSRS